MYAIFTRSRPRAMHAAHEGANATVCGLPIGTGSGLVRDGDYHGSAPCARCWTPAPSLETGTCPRCGVLCFRSDYTGPCAACVQSDHEPQGEAVRLFEPAPTQLPDQTSLSTN